CGPTPNCPACRLASECNYFNRPRKPEISRRTPADRLLDGQAVSVSDAELLAALFFGEKATGQEKAIPALFDRYGRLSAMFRADPREYSALRNVERGQAVRLAAAAALHRRTLAEIRDAKIVIGSASDMYHHYADWFRETEGSATLTVLLDTNNQVIRAILLAGGSSRANPADIARQALLDNAPRLAVLRNTAGPIAPPSLDEADFDRRLASICAIIGIRLVDHVIVGNNGYYSFAEAGTLAQG
ncbi:MAG: hypothetical protein LBE84_01350, partial [Planctomycetota bacterium]|nr:hypothetical protein [Planctomycetota bacterium]